MQLIVLGFPNPDYHGEKATQASQAAAETANALGRDDDPPRGRPVLRRRDLVLQVRTRPVFLLILALSTVAIAASRLAHLPVIW